MKLKLMQAILLIVLTSVFLAACGGGGSSSGGGSITVSAQVDTETFTVMPTPTWLDKVYAFFGGETVYALGTGVVNKVVAIASSETGIYLDGTVTANIASDGSFSISLDRSYEWVLLLVNTEAPNKYEEVVSYVATKVTDTDNLVAYSGANLTSNLALGTLVNDGDEAVGTPDLLAFDLDLEQLTAVAQADNGYKHMINAYLNYDPETGRSYGIAPIVGIVAGDIADFNQPPEASLVETYEVDGLSFFLETVDLELPLNMTDICKGLSDFGLYPSGTIEDTNGRVYDASNGIVNDISLEVMGSESDMGVGNEALWDDGCGDDDMGVQFYPDDAWERHAFMSFKTGGYPLIIPDTGMPEGHWELRSGKDAAEEVIAEFDLAVGSPIDDSGNLTMPVPVIEVITKADGEITAINTHWFVYSSSANNNAGGYIKLEARNLLAVGSLVSGSVVSVQDGDNVHLRDPNDYSNGPGDTPYPYQSDGLWTEPINFVSETPSWYLPGSSGHLGGGRPVTFIRVDVAVGGVDNQFGFTYTQPPM